VLNREVCYKCFTHPHSREAQDVIDCYDRWFNGTWDQEGKAVCCVLAFGRANIKGNPPERCPYALEHIVSEERNEEEIAQKVL
jgi:hypothetical protein